MKFAIVSIVCLTLFGCAGTQPDIIVTKPQVIVPPAALLRCSDVKLPSKFTTDKDVASSYVRLWKHIHNCHNNALAVRKFLQDAQKDVIPSP